MYQIPSFSNKKFWLRSRHDVSAALTWMKMHRISYRIINRAVIYLSHIFSRYILLSCPIWRLKSHIDCIHILITRWIRNMRTVSNYYWWKSLFVYFLSQLANQSAHILFKSAKRLICFCVHCIILLILYLIFTLSIYFRQTTRGVNMKSHTDFTTMNDCDHYWSISLFYVLFNLMFNRNTPYTICSYNKY